MTHINISDTVFFIKVFSFGNCKTKRRELQIADLVQRT